MINYSIQKVFRSWIELKECKYSLEDIYSWIADKNRSCDVRVEKICFNHCKPWYYNEQIGQIQNINRTFFQVAGIVQKQEDIEVVEQPIIIQDEIGYLGIVCKKINGVLHFLMQAKIEPGNVNRIQISPTIQATKSNFMKKHGGKQPLYLEYFVNVKPENVIVDQIQSEQSSRFLKKRNRNIIIEVTEEIEESPNHRWMTLGQIKELMKQDNLVNMDTRTVLSCIPVCFNRYSEDMLKELETIFNNKSLFNSIFLDVNNNEIIELYNYINNIKMFNEKRLEYRPLHRLKNWVVRENEITCKENYPFKVIFCNISIEGREVQQWNQPLFEATGMATFGLIICNDCGTMKFLVKASAEIGCFDSVEIGPSVQLEATEYENVKDNVEKLFFNKLNNNKGVIYNTILSEEGGRFYHEQNHNIIIEINKNELTTLPKGYFWMSYHSLNLLTQVNNCLNIQLRNLLSVLEV